MKRANEQTKQTKKQANTPQTRCAFMSGRATAMAMTDRLRISTRAINVGDEKPTFTSLTLSLNQANYHHCCHHHRHNTNTVSITVTIIVIITTIAITITFIIIPFSYLHHTIIITSSCDYHIITIPPSYNYHTNITQSSYQHHTISEPISYQNTAPPGIFLSE